MIPLTIRPGDLAGERLARLIEMISLTLYDVNERLDRLEAALTVGGDGSVTLKSSNHLTILSQNRIAIRSANALLIESALSATVTAQTDLKLEGGKTTVEGRGETTVRAGSASMLMKADGSLHVQGKDVSVKATGNIVMKGQKILQN